MDDIRKSEDFQHSIRCPICDSAIDYIGNLDKTKEFGSDRVKVDETFVLLGQGNHTTEGYRLALETVVTCPNCEVKIKIDHSTKLLD